MQDQSFLDQLTSQFNSEDFVLTDFLINIFITMTNDLRLLTEKDICRLFQVSESTLKRRVNSGNFPQPIKFGRLNRWRYTDVLQVYNNQFNGGNGNAFA